MNLDYIFTTRQKTYPEIGTPDIRRKIANELRSAREFNEMSYDQIRSITKINNVYLENLEAGNWSFLPAVYVKLFIKAYASAVKVQSDEFTNRLDEVFDSIKPADYSAEQQEYFGDHLRQTRHAHASGFMTWIEKNRSILFYGMITCIAVILVGYYLMHTPKTGMPAFREAPVESDTTSHVQRKDTISVATEQPEVVELELIQTSAIKTFELGLIASGTCYVKVEHGDSTLYDRTLWPGNVIRYEYPDSIKVTLGNAPEIRLLVNGDTLPPFPENRKVRVFRLTSEGIVQ